MPPGKEKTNKQESEQFKTIKSIMQDVLIAQLATSAIPPGDIRDIVGCSQSKVSRITKHMKGTKNEK